MVRLKHVTDSIGVSPVSGFQFQNGTIKALDALAGGCNPRLFQFQNGTIKAK